MDNKPLDLPAVSNHMPHFEEIDGRKVLYVDGSPYTVLSVEIPWWDLPWGHYNENKHVYDYLYPAAKKVGLNTIKVPVKWSMVEPEQGVYDFTYVDHVKKMAEANGLKVVLGWFGHYASGDGNIYRNLSGEVFAPMYVIEDDKTYPRAVDADGIPHHNSISYDYNAVVAVETAAFKAFMDHIREIDSEDHTVIMIQVENEIAVFGADRQNRKMWRDHSEASNRDFEAHGFTDDLKYSAWSLTTKWLQPLTNAGKSIYPLPFFVNFVGGKHVDWMVGGSPGEDVETYLQNCPAIDFCGLNLYVQPGRSLNDIWAALSAYKVGRNLPAITEANSDRSRMAPRMAYMSIGTFGSPIFAPWALNVSYPTSYQPYVLEDGTIANGGFELKECYESINMALAPIACYGGTDRARVFMALQPGQRFTELKDIMGTQVTVNGDDNGQAIVIKPADNEFIVVGYRCGVSILTDKALWPAMKELRAEEGRFEGTEWIPTGEGRLSVNQSARTVGVSLPTPTVIRIWL